MIAKNKQKERICSDCGLPKPKGEFIKKSNRCRECRRQFWRAYKQALKRGHRKNSSAEIGIETWEQVDSLIREMAESQFEIKKEYADLEKRIVLLKKYTENAVEPELIHQMKFRFMLKEFLKKTTPKGQVVTRRFDFGILRFHRGKLDVELNTVYAGQRMDKP
ncbi:MAG: hypothetical protein ABSF37_03065 [Sedimentisphaerales bacterium]|jgi:hypothetical protein